MHILGLSYMSVLRLKASKRGSPESTKNHHTYLIWDFVAPLYKFRYKALALFF
jgi:hypothetical protein